MSCSASSISRKRGAGPDRANGAGGHTARHGRGERVIARLLVATLITAHPLTASAGEEFGDANNTTFDQNHVQLDNQQAGQTIFTIDTNRTTIGWQELRQPENNRLEFNFTKGGRNAAVLNYSESMNAIRLSGQVVSNGTVGFANPYGVFVDGTAVIDVGSLVAIGGNVSREAFLAGGAMEIPLQGRVENRGLIRADRNVALLATSVLNAGEILAGDGNVLLIGGQRIELPDFDAFSSGFAGSKDFRIDLTGGDVTNAGSIASSDAAFFGGRVVNLGEIEIEDGSLLMVGADAVWVTRFDNPVLIRLPRGSVGAADGSPRYAVENHGQIDAGQGHVRLAAADPLGFGIRQGTGTAERAARIAARKIEIEGGEQGRVHLSGELDASDRSKNGRGGEIDVTGEIIALADAKLDASGTRGGGEIQIGGEQQGGGDLQRARSVVIDGESEIHADALARGDGGRVIVFSEDLTSIEGGISARGGAKGGDGGFVETSGLRHFAIADAPDVSARRGRAGSWLIDPYDITIQNLPADCTSPPIPAACQNRDLDIAIDKILAPDFDSAGFDGILRTTGTGTNYVSSDLIERALGIGTNITLSTQAFLDDDQALGNGDIRFVDAITIDSARVLAGTVARLTLLAAGDIFVDQNIEVLPAGGRSNLALSVNLHANDAGQTGPARDFALDLVEGNVYLDADIRTGGGSFVATGISILQSLGRQIVTLGGDVTLISGSVSPDRSPFSQERSSDAPDLVSGTLDTKIEILGDIDTRTSDGRQSGGDVTLIASSINVGVNQSGNDLLSMVTGFLSVAGDILTGGGSIGLTGGVVTATASSPFAGSVEVTGNLDSDGGDIAIRANRVNPASGADDFDVTLVAPQSEPGRSDGGVIQIDGTVRTAGGSLRLGNDTAKTVVLDGTFDTTQGDSRENGLVRIVARDSTGIDTSSDARVYGNGQIQIGSNGATTISTAGLVARTRDLTLSDGTGANAVDIALSGDSSSTTFDVLLDDDAQNDDQTGDSPLVGVLDLLGTRSVTLNQDSELTAETIRITAAPDPLQLSSTERAVVPVPPADDPRFTRLVFGGTNGAGDTAADGVRLNADQIFLGVGDGATATGDLFSGDLGTLAAPTDFGLQRQTRGNYQGLQLRSRIGALRPETLSIRQDAGLTITQGAATGVSELDLAGAFGGALIGTEGMRIAIESSDGGLTIEDAAGFNDNAGPLGPNDAGKSFVTLLGGLLLPASPGGTTPDPETVPSPNSVVFRDGTAVLGADGTTAFSVESLAISTPGDFSVTQQIADGIAAVAELVFTAGRFTLDEAGAGRGTLTIAAATSLAASERLALQAGGSGFGDLVFAGPGTSLAADEIDLAAGPAGESRNSDASDLSRIVGLQAQNVGLRDAQGAVFGDAGSSADAFRYRQAAAIDAATDLPTLAQFGLTTGFRAAGDVEYAVRSDQGKIDLDDGVAGTNEADRFRNAALSLIGFQSSSVPAIEVSADTAFVGKQVELGGVGRFSFTAALARVFNRTGAAADESLTLRSGVGGSGSLDFVGDAGSPVLVKAPTVTLAAGDGPGGGSGSSINTSNASFDLAGPGAARTFAYQMDGTFRVADLPGTEQFVGGAAGLPNVLAIRNDGGAITIDDFDAEELPIALASGPSRLVLEADTIELNQTDGDDLALTTNPNLFLRLRANVLTLIASVSTNDDTEDGRVRMGPRVTDTQRVAGTDAQFDGESLLVESFDLASEDVTTGNLSTLSEEPDDSGLFDLAAGRGPTSVAIRQDGSVEAADLADHRSFSGLLARTIRDDADEDPIATLYSIASLLAGVTVTPEKVNGSRLVLAGVAGDLDKSEDRTAITFAPGAGAIPGLFLLDGVTAATPDSILVRAGTQLVARDSIALTAGVVGLPTEKVTAALGAIHFEGNHGDGQLTRLEANTISLTAGPTITLTDPDDDRDGVRENVPNPLLPKLDLSGLDQLVLAGDPATSALRLRQSASFDTRRGGEGDFLTALEAGADQAGAGGDEWNELELGSVQGELRVAEVGLLADESSQLIARTGTEGTLVVDMPNQADRPAPFDDFADGARFESNDITFQSSDPGTSLNLATDKLLLVALALTGLQNPNDFGRLRSDMATDDEATQLRPIVRIHQAAAFTNSQLPRPNQYSVLELTGETRSRGNLSGLDIELRTTAPATTLTLDDAVRARTTGANLILRSAGDVAIALEDRTPGYEDLPAYAALQLSSLEIEANAGTGTIAIQPFTIDGLPADLTLETEGDQRYGGTLALSNTLVTTGRAITFAGDVTQSGAPGAGLVVGAAGKVRFAGNVGSLANRLDRLWLLFDGSSGNGEDDRTPSVEFGRRIDTDGDGIAETPIASNQGVFTQNDILIVASDLPTRTLIAKLNDPDPNVANDGIDSVDNLAELEILLRQPGLELGRDHPANFATVAKGLGDLLFDSLGGLFTTSPGEKISVAGNLSIEASAGLAAFSDVSALSLQVDAGQIGLLRRNAGVTLDASGQTHQDGGPAIVANSFDFGGATPSVIGSGRKPRFGLPDPFRASSAYPFLDALPVFGIRPGGRALTAADFRFTGSGSALGEQVPFLMPTGPSRSDLSGAYGPVRVPTAKLALADPLRLVHPERLRALDVEARPMPASTLLARLAGAAVIDDRALASDGTSAVVTEARLDARDSEAAIGLYARLFGANDERTGHVRGVLQNALDQYREIHRSQRVVGFELRRFVKNRPSTLIEAYTTLEDLDTLFRYHRRLGLSPGEYKRIQRGWLEKIQPEGIGVDELAETIHPSRYVRGSDILDIFGQ